MKRADQAAQIAARVHKDLTTAEAGLDVSLDRLARLTRTLVRSRRDARLSSTVGQPVLDAVTRAMNAQVEAQRAMVEAHQALATVQSKTAFRNVRLDGFDKEDEWKPRETRTPLRAVDHAA